MKLAERIRDALMHAVVELDEDVLDLIKRAYGQEEREPAKAVLDAILKNLELAKETGLPMCQDTGLFLVFADVGRTCPLSFGSIEASIMEGCETAVQQAYFRRSIVAEPVFDRTNTQNNLPPAIWWNLVEGSGLTLRILLKGFGSENCSSVRMLNPTGGKEAVVEAVRQIVQKAGGKPCPPIFVGVGLGGTMDRAAYLSKRALLRDVRQANSDARYAALEQEILASIQTLGIGSGGLGGTITALHVAVEQESTHIAGLPLAVSINCWADRKATITWKEGEDA
ncbi:MAG: fumarate hydratase [Sphaerochaeta sp.]|uniref:fumarate hydratase n=1 Tax=unclassified Sphaerochaeta TaxID=2637943 RepID=UPI0025F7CC4F|nr:MULTISPECIES: fumarate hydratase [unclassified Sphaerochaeta]MCK9600662.1 fumarate hydratase [Sphaerochaeta sp.]MDX9823743.1 fumarate hydratase [Sphaerochaeta sp.]HPE92645.1 fumarate hydratase [Sphaerochaeta sp.]